MYLGEDVAGFVQSGHLEPVILLHESKASRVGLHLGGNGPKEAWKHLSVREGGGGGSIGDLCSAQGVLHTHMSTLLARFVVGSLP